MIQVIDKNVDRIVKSRCNYLKKFIKKIINVNINTNL